MGNNGKIVLYHGSLDELNSRDPKRQYKFAKDPTFVSNSRPGDSYDSFNEKVEEELKREIEERGYDGLVNRRTGSHKAPIRTLFFVEGTPIVRLGGLERVSKRFFGKSRE